MTKIEVEIKDDNPFNTGWLAYVLGLDRPEADADPFGADGWDMGYRTPDLRNIRNVFLQRGPTGESIEEPGYKVRLVRDEPSDMTDDFAPVLPGPRTEIKKKVAVDE